MLRAALQAEQIGIPSISIVSTAFRKQAEVVGKGLGLGDVALAEYPGVINSDSPQVLRDKARSAVLQQVIASLGRVPRPVAPPAEPGPRDIVFRGDLDEVQDHFHQRLWSDGMAIVPPTPDRVERFLRHTRRAAGEVLGLHPPDFREATVWNVAVNAVMAGCRPEYMPVLLAAVEAMLDPQFRLEDAGATPGWEPLVIVSGPVVKELNFNVETGAMRVGRQANTSIGRFMRLFMRNVGGLRPSPEGGDKGTISFTFNVALAENEEAVRALGWPTFGADRGFGPQDSVVTVQSVASISNPVYTFGESAAQHMALLAKVCDHASRYWSHLAAMFGAWHPLVVMTPSVAGVFARDGWTKDDIRQYLHREMRIPARELESYAYRDANDLYALVQSGRADPAYGQSRDPDRLVPVFPWAESINIVVAGDPGRNQSKCYVQNHKQGIPVSRKVEAMPIAAAQA